MTIVTYLLTGGPVEFHTEFRRVLAREIPVRLIVNRFEKMPHRLQDSLVQLKETYPRLRLLNYSHAESELHAKVILVDRSRAIIGSANLTGKAMVANHELAVVLESRAEVADAVRAVDQLVDSGALRSIASARE